jgi:N6-adenosine-specific RNA methylase IME4
VKYNTIVVDPPWPQPDSGARTQSMNGNWRGKWLGYVSEIPYQTMNMDDIKALPISDYADKDAHLYLWTTNRFLSQSFDVAAAWGFRFSTLLTWAKAPMGIGLGGAFTITTEFCLFCRRGSLKPKERLDSTWFNWRRPYNENGAPSHSQKPEAFIDLVERVSPGPYLEMFARRQRLGWGTWGNECFVADGLPEVAPL